MSSQTHGQCDCFMMILQCWIVLNPTWREDSWIDVLLLFIAENLSEERVQSPPYHT